MIARLWSRHCTMYSVSIASTCYTNVYENKIHEHLSALYYDLTAVGICTERQPKSIILHVRQITSKFLLSLLESSLAGILGTWKVGLVLKLKKNVYSACLHAIRKIVTSHTWNFGLDPMHMNKISKKLIITCTCSEYSNFTRESYFQSNNNKLFHILLSKQPNWSVPPSILWYMCVVIDINNV